MSLRLPQNGLADAATSVLELQNVNDTLSLGLGPLPHILSYLDVTFFKVVLFLR
jgi:hypothetical protein